MRSTRTFPPRSRAAARPLSLSSGSCACHGGISEARPGESAAPPPAIVASHLRKRFPGVVAIDDVNVAIVPGEIVALLGQNGAGKSTLIQIFAGVHPAGSYSGAMVLAGALYRPVNVADAERKGVA